MLLLTLIFTALSKGKTYAILDDGIKAQDFTITGAGFDVDSVSENDYKKRETLYSNNAFNTISEVSQPSNKSGNRDFIVKTCGDEVQSSVYGVVKRAVNGNNKKSGFVEIMTKEGLVAYTDLKNILVSTGDGIVSESVLGEAAGSFDGDICTVGILVN